ncbi:DUF3300 domain-containing protein [Ralstonia pseudosolanacearum]|uniref:DUF3300 domain-containing protein n=1 Tax=Ralstonia pseudosolanacearum TaxID=1310165 RepID=UPI00399D6B5C
MPAASAPLASAPAAALAQAPVTPPYTPPTAEQLDQMVAPIALFPDKLVAQVLAGAAYPEQITAANQWLAQNAGLKGDALQAAANQQPWDPSVKSLTAFPAVLSQMSGNTQWTTALGEAYVNDPNDVFNAIQVMRQRAQRSGTLKSSKQMVVSTVARSAPAPKVYSNQGDAPPVYAGPAVVHAPPQTIVIEPARPDVVYVPSYNPAVVYGNPVPVYPSYSYSPPAYSSGELVATGAISFGLGVIVGAAISHHYDWGWQAWGMNWGGGAGGISDAGSGDSGWHQPAVVYNNQTYVSKSTTVVNHFTNVNNSTNINNERITNNYGTINNNNSVHSTTINNTGTQPALAPPQMNVARAQGAGHVSPMSMPHFSAADMHAGAMPQQVDPHGAKFARLDAGQHASVVSEEPHPKKALAAIERDHEAALRADVAAQSKDSLRDQNKAATATEQRADQAHKVLSAHPEQLNSEPHAQAHPESHAQAHPESHAQAHPEPHAQAHPEPHAQAHPESHAQAHPEPHAHEGEKHHG